MAQSLKTLARQRLNVIREMEQEVEPAWNTPENGGTSEGHSCSTVPPAVPSTRGLSMEHPWLGQAVSSPRGAGRLTWTDGFRAGIVRPGEEEVLWLVDLADVELAK